MTAVTTLDEREELQKEECREILTFLKDNIKNLTPLHFDTKRKEQLIEYVSIWRFLISHSYFEAPYEHLNKDKPPIGWLHNLLISHRDVPGLITLLAAPGVRQSMDLKNGADILMLKLSRITSYVTPPVIPKTFYLPPDDPKKTDQDGIPWKQSPSDAAKNWRFWKTKAKKEKESLLPKPKPVVTEEETEAKRKAHLKAKNKQRKAFKKDRDDAKKDADTRYEIAKRDEEKRRKRTSGH